MNQITIPPQEFLILIVTGLSGAGKTSVMRTLEDSGFYCVDNLPVPLIFTFLNLVLQTRPHTCKVALGIDARGQQYLQYFLEEVAKLKKAEPFHQLKIMFLKASEETLIKRFQETRRNHPLVDENTDLINAIKEEFQLLEPIMHIADITLDTDIFNVHELRNWVRQSFATQHQRKMLVNLVSFGFKYGLPADSNLVFDVRFLPNPYFIPELKSLTGKDAEIQEFVFSKPETATYWQLLLHFITITLEKYYEEGRYFVTIAIGCTGGKHRSVSFIEKLATTPLPNTHVLIQHRDITRE
ncbi:RNase adapter RapZ [Candidatus Dependentiae bacterium]|nr:RNase adapter RapZ [Candidatus Dependentiae bacterium]